MPGGPAGATRGGEAEPRGRPVLGAAYGMRIAIHPFVAAVLAAAVALPAAAQGRRPVVAVFAHPDDERIVGPLLSRLAREGRETHLVIATDGSKGVRDFAKIPAGPEL